MKICLLSDTHENHDQIKIPKCDLLIHCGDFSNLGSINALESFNDWVRQLKNDGTIKYCVLCPGNHDMSLSQESNKYHEAYKMILGNVDHILIHEGVQIENKKIWGCSFVPTYFNWAFMKDEDDLYWIYNQIPVNLDILICHGPPLGILDRNDFGKHCGSFSMKSILKYKSPKYYFCGHIHPGRGLHFEEKTTIINCSSVDCNYNPLPPIVLEI